MDGASLAVNSFGGLYTYDAEGQLVPDFATGCTVSEDGLVYTFTLRDGLKWSDGGDLTAKDFEWSWKRCRSPPPPPTTATCSTASRAIRTIWP